MPKSRGRKQRKNKPTKGAPGSVDPSTAEATQPSSSAASALAATLAMSGMSSGPDPAGWDLEVSAESFMITIGHRAIAWPQWPRCVAATRSGDRCSWPAYPDAPGVADPHAVGAYVIGTMETFGSREAEALRRLVTQRCHLHDGSGTPTAVAFEGRVSGDDEAWLAELQLRAGVDARRAYATRHGNQERLATTECPTCHVVDTPRCVTASGRPALELHSSRVRAVFGDESGGRLPVV